ncbi:S-adenosylmethionine:tRNA ribosyltransferase-isomerase [Rhizosphaericola mali]|uniref:S-adenosylmethionine:tRNA ribosyltransferase-isomerase n=1 Tax=Rhizosphaericola mali TaxID=2545455 RepID=A0A5P2GG20_9BACT|nr:S-adenosylmethionine:tRNA ribosyltransferase-isomerase [Rhizosphaericola mali]QES90621.1 S-adenosylmethionine:tRNA ribosyltransferase-isomerase [Rhizosphaericola mali]
MHPQELAIADFTYDLPDSKIAKYPLAQRDASKLLIYNHGDISESQYYKLDEYLPANTLLVFNNTKVVEARILFYKETGSKIELFCLEPDDRYNDITSAMLEKKEVYWKCLIGGAKKWKSGALTHSFEFNGKNIELNATQIEKRNDYFLIHFQWNETTLSFAEILHFAGIIPLPPYLKRETEESDKDRYQTVYAKYDGSVAAPTAGLHFTTDLLENLGKKGIEHDFVTLHVGAGTFKPVKADTMGEHEMHYEAIDVKKSFIQNLLNHLDGKIIPVGTTSIRTLESLYWIGVKCHLGKLTSLHDDLTQWEPYELPQDIDAKTALSALIKWLEDQKMDRLLTRTQIIIAPGYQLRIADGLITNFHQPQSTLILLVAAIVGDKWREIYQYALTHDFRFLSYGDGSLLWK